jgi:16S rRNA (cytidine1402-2'-O)-methyltransferase
VITALSVSGADTAERGNGVAGTDGGWLFAGFLPSKGRERQQALAALLAQRRAVVLLEAPHRRGALCQELAALGQRPVTLARELTKQFENVHTLPADGLSAWLQGAPERSKGEFVVVIHPLPPAVAADESVDPRAEQVLRLLLAELPVKTAVRLAAEITDAPRNGLYDRALAIQQDKA